MKLSRPRIALAILLVAFIFGAVTLLYWDFVRDTIVVPVYYSLWVGNLVLNSIPQAVFVGIVILIGVYLGASALRSIPASRSAGQPSVNRATVDTRYLHWRRLSDNLHTSRFSRSLMVSDTRKLILSILAYEQGIDPAEAAVLIRRGEISLPENLHSLFQPSTINDPAPEYRLLADWLQRLRRALGQTDPAQFAEADQLVEECIAFIEQHLEIPDGGNRSEA